MEKILQKNFYGQAVGKADADTFFDFYRLSGMVLVWAAAWIFMIPFQIQKPALLYENFWGAVLGFFGIFKKVTVTVQQTPDFMCGLIALAVIIFLQFRGIFSVTEKRDFKIHEKNQKAVRVIFNVLSIIVHTLFFTVLVKIFLFPETGESDFAETVKNNLGVTVFTACSITGILFGSVSVSKILILIFTAVSVFLNIRTVSGILGWYGFAGILMAAAGLYLEFYVHGFNRRRILIELKLFTGHFDSALKELKKYAEENPVLDESDEENIYAEENKSEKKSVEQNNSTVINIEENQKAGEKKCLNNSVKKGRKSAGKNCCIKMALKTGYLKKAVLLWKKFKTQEFRKSKDWIKKHKENIFRTAFLLLLSGIFIAFPVMVFQKVIRLNSGYKGLNWGSSFSQVKEWVSENSTKGSFRKCSSSHSGVLCYRLDFKNPEPAGLDFIEFQFQNEKLCAVIENFEESENNPAVNLGLDFNLQKDGKTVQEYEAKVKGVKYRYFQKNYAEEEKNYSNPGKIRYGLARLFRIMAATGEKSEKGGEGALNEKKERNAGAEKTEIIEENLKFQLTCGYYSSDYIEEKTDTAEFPAFRFDR